VDKFKSVQLFDAPICSKKGGFCTHQREAVEGFDAKIIAMDATTIKKSGEHTFGIDKFWSSCAGKAVRGIEYS
jgi:hypothetical protein